MDQTALEQRLEPTHLKSTADMKAELTEAVAAPEPPKDPNKDPKAKLSYTFNFAHTDARGKVWEGTFTHVVPTLAQRDLIDLLQARKKANMPVESFAAMAAERHLYVSHLDVCLTERPDWATNLDNLHDPAIVQKLYREVASHEAYFLGWGEDQSGSKDERQDGGRESP